MSRNPPAPSSEEARKCATEICIHIFGKHFVSEKDVAEIAAIVDKALKERRP